jgi:hypothetical protein
MSARHANKGAPSNRKTWSNMNRRLFITTSTGLAASGLMGRSLALFTVGTQPAIAVVDPSLIESVRWASAAVRDGAHVIACRDDVAALWYAELAHAHVPLVGALRGSDFFVLRHLARSDGRSVSRKAADAGAVAFHIGAPASFDNSRIGQI